MYKEKLLFKNLCCRPWVKTHAVHGTHHLSITELGVNDSPESKDSKYNPYKIKPYFYQIYEHDFLALVKKKQRKNKNEGQSSGNLCTSVFVLFLKGAKPRLQLTPKGSVAEGQLLMSFLPSAMVYKGHSQPGAKAPVTPKGVKAWFRWVPHKNHTVTNNNLVYKNDRRWASAHAVEVKYNDLYFAFGPGPKGLRQDKMDQRRAASLEKTRAKPTKIDFFLETKYTAEPKNESQSASLISPPLGEADTFFRLLSRQRLPVNMPIIKMGRTHLGLNAKSISAVYASQKKTVEPLELLLPKNHYERLDYFVPSQLDKEGNILDGPQPTSTFPIFKKQRSLKFLGFLNSINNKSFLSYWLIPVAGLALITAKEEKIRTRSNVGADYALRQALYTKQSLGNIKDKYVQTPLCKYLSFIINKPMVGCSQSVIHTIWPEGKSTQSLNILSLSITSSVPDNDKVSVKKNLLNNQVYKVPKKKLGFVNEGNKVQPTFTTANFGPDSLNKASMVVFVFPKGKKEVLGSFLCSRFEYAQQSCANWKNQGQIILKLIKNQNNLYFRTINPLDSKTFINNALNFIITENSLKLLNFKIIKLSRSLINFSDDKCISRAFFDKPFYPSVYKILSTIFPVWLWGGFHPPQNHAAAKMLLAGKYFYVDNYELKPKVLSPDGNAKISTRAQDGLRVFVFPKGKKEVLGSFLCRFSPRCQTEGKNLLAFSKLNISDIAENLLNNFLSNFFTQKRGVKYIAKNDLIKTSIDSSYGFGSKHRLAPIFTTRFIKKKKYVGSRASLYTLLRPNRHVTKVTAPRGNLGVKKGGINSNSYILLKKFPILPRQTSPLGTQARSQEELGPKLNPGVLYYNHKVKQPLVKAQRDEKTKEKTNKPGAKAPVTNKILVYKNRFELSILFKHQKMFNNNLWSRPKGIVDGPQPTKTFGIKPKRDTRYVFLSSKMKTSKKIAHITCKQSLEKIKIRLHLQKKRKAKKQRLETRRQKKRTRLFPRPMWLRYRMFFNFLKQTWAKAQDLSLRATAVSKSSDLYVLLPKKQLIFIAASHMKITKKSDTRGFFLTSRPPIFLNNNKKIKPNPKKPKKSLKVLFSFLENVNLGVKRIKLEHPFLYFQNNLNMRKIQILNRVIVKQLELSYLQKDRRWASAHLILPGAKAPVTSNELCGYKNMERSYGLKPMEQRRDIKIKAKYINFKNQKTNNPPPLPEKDNDTYTLCRDFWIWAYNTTNNHNNFKNLLWLLPNNTSSQISPFTFFNIKNPQIVNNNLPKGIFGFEQILLAKSKINPFFKSAYLQEENKNLDFDGLRRLKKAKAQGPLTLADIKINKYSNLYAAFGPAPKGAAAWFWGGVSPPHHNHTGKIFDKDIINQKNLIHFAKAPVTPKGVKAWFRGVPHQNHTVTNNNLVYNSKQIKTAFAIKRLYWALNKTNTNSFTDYNKRYNLWGTQKLRNQSKNNKTKYLENQFIKYYLNFFVEARYNYQPGTKAPVTNNILVYKKNTSKSLWASTKGSNHTNINSLRSKGKNKLLNKKITSKIRQKKQKLNYLTSFTSSLKKQKTLKKIEDHGSIKLAYGLRPICKFYTTITYQKNIKIFNRYFWLNSFIKTNFNKYLNGTYGFIKPYKTHIFASNLFFDKNKSEGQSSGLILSSSILLHFCALISLVSISRVRCFVKFHVILLYKLSNIYNTILLTVSHQIKKKQNLNLNHLNFYTSNTRLRFPWAESHLRSSIPAGDKVKGVKLKKKASNIILANYKTARVQIPNKLLVNSIFSLCKILNLPGPKAGGKRWKQRIPGAKAPATNNLLVERTAFSFYPRPGMPLGEAQRDEDEQTSFLFTYLFLGLLNKKFKPNPKKPKKSANAKEDLINRPYYLQNRLKIKTRGLAFGNGLGIIVRGSKVEKLPTLSKTLHKLRGSTNRVKSIFDKYLNTHRYLLPYKNIIYSKLNIISLKAFFLNKNKNNLNIFKSKSLWASTKGKKKKYLNSLVVFEGKYKKEQKKALIKKKVNILVVSLKNARLKVLRDLIDIFQISVRTISSFFEKPAEFTSHFIAYGFLVEWSSDLQTIIPENVDISIWNICSKFSRVLPNIQIVLTTKASSLVPFLNLNNTSVFYANNFIYINNKFDFFVKTKKYVGFLKSSGLPLLFLISHLLSKIISYLFDTFLETLSQPDADLIRRQEKGKRFWDIWADFLITAADYYTVNVAALSTIKAEQNTLVDKISNDFNIFYTSFDQRATTNKINDRGINRSRGATQIVDFVNFIDQKSVQRHKKEPTRHKNNNPSWWEHILINNMSSFHNKASIKLAGMHFKKVEFDSPCFSYEDQTGAQRDDDSLPLKGALTIYPPGILERPLKNHVHIFGKVIKNFNVNQSITYQSWPNGDLFMDYHPAKSFSHIPIIKYNSVLQQPIGTLVCQIYSGIFNKQISKNILLVNTKTTTKQRIHDGPQPTNYNVLLLQALAGETELKIITDNAQRYERINRGFAIGIKLLRDVFDAIALNTPCIFLLEDIHKIGERRPMLISDYGSAMSDDNGSFKEDFFGSQRDEVHEKNQVVYQLTRHKITHYKKPFKGDYASAIPTNLYVTDLFLRVPTQSTSNLSLVENHNLTIKNKIKNSEFTNFKTEHNSSPRGNDDKKSHFQFVRATKRNSRGAKRGLDFKPPSTSPFAVFLLKEGKKFKPNKIVEELPWTGLPGEQLLTKPRTSYSVRAKVLMLAEFSLSNLSAKLDMITDLLVIIDSVRSNKGFVVFATTNLPHILDPALRRPGRLDETICLPDISTSNVLNFNTNYEIIKTVKPYTLSTVNHLNNILKGQQTLLLFKPFSFYFKNTPILTVNLKDYNKTINKLNPENLGHHFSLNYAKYKTKKLFIHFALSPATSNEQSVDKQNDRRWASAHAVEVKDLNCLDQSQKTYPSGKGKGKDKYKAIAYYEVGKIILNYYLNNLHSINKAQYLAEGSELIFKSINYLSLYGSKNKLLLQLMLIFGGKISQLISSRKKASFYNYSLNNFVIDNRLAFGLTAGKRQTLVHAQVLLDNPCLFLQDKNFQLLTDLMLSFIQKRYLYLKNLIVPKLLSFADGNILEEPPSPPFSNLLIPAKRFENYKRVFHDSISGDKMGQRNAQISLTEKLQSHAQLRSISLLLDKNNNTKAVRIGLDGLRPIFDPLFDVEVKQLAKTIEDGPQPTSTFTTFTNINWYYQNRILKRHGQYLTNQWWNGQLSEHNAETVFLSDIDWRASFIKNKQKNNYIKSKKIKNFLSISLKKRWVETHDVLLDFPDTDQYYNPRRRRWLLNKGYWSFWFNFDKIYSEEMIYTWILESIIQTYSYLHNNTELLDFVASKFIHGLFLCSQLEPLISAPRPSKGLLLEHKNYNAAKLLKKGGDAQSFGEDLRPWASAQESKILLNSVKEIFLTNSFKRF
uniref:Cell division protein FTSH n=1 Tax=Tetrabaena socialis TaxID=47790 RepID=A0A1B1FK51_9CHLO|nr:cell division protein FTSH [Tetrabaena socialis]